MQNSTWSSDYVQGYDDDVGSGQLNRQSFLTGFKQPSSAREAIATGEGASSLGRTSSDNFFGGAPSGARNSASHDPLFPPTHKSSEDFLSDAIGSLTLNRNSNTSNSSSAMFRLDRGRNDDYGFESSAINHGLRSSQESKNLGLFNASSSAPVLQRRNKNQFSSFDPGAELRNAEFDVPVRRDPASQPTGLSEPPGMGGLGSRDTGKARPPGLSNLSSSSSTSSIFSGSNVPLPRSASLGDQTSTSSLFTSAGRMRGNEEFDTPSSPQLRLGKNAFLDLIQEDSQILEYEHPRNPRRTSGGGAGLMASSESEQSTYYDQRSASDPSSGIAASQGSQAGIGTHDQQALNDQGARLYQNQTHSQPQQQQQFSQVTQQVQYQNVNQGNVPMVQGQALYDAQGVYYGTTHVQGVDRRQQGAPISQPPPSVIQTPYGYATIQYHTTQPTTIPPQVQPNPQIIHGSAIDANGREFIPAMAPAPAYAYWPGGVPASQGMVPSISIINPTQSPLPIPGQLAQHGSSTSPSLRQKAARTDRKTKQTRGNSTKRDSRNSTSSNGINSALLDDFRTNKGRVWTMADVEGHVVEFCQDQNGSRLIQQHLELSRPGDKEIVMTEVLPAVRKLRNDVFGNYVVQKLFEHGTPEMKAELRETLRGEMLALSLQIYGCRVVQKALESLDDNDLPGLLSEFHHNVISCIHDQNGNHVIQKCIEVMSSKARDAREAGDMAMADHFISQVEFIVDDVLNNVATLSCHPYGCRVLQRILEHCVDPKKSRALDEIRKCHELLLDDQYGNYVIQHVLQYGRQGDRESILKLVCDKGILGLSKQKFASNVVEKLLKYGTAGQRNALVREMLEVVDEQTGNPASPGTDGSSSVVLLMVRDAYANYVVQTTLDVIAEGPEKRLLLEELNAHSSLLKNYAFAKHIVTKLGS